MGVINIPASKSLTVSSKIPNRNIKDKKIIVGSKGKDVYYSYLFFDTDIIPSNIELLSATLVLFKVADFFNCPIQKFAIYPLLAEFSSFTTHTNDCPIDHDRKLKRVFSPFVKDAAIEVDITDLVNKWINNILVNRGVAIKGYKTTKYILSHTCFGSAYSSDSTIVPFLRVSFKQKSCLCCLPITNVSYTAKAIPSIC